MRPVPRLRSRLSQAGHVVHVCARQGGISALCQWRPFSSTAFDLLHSLRRHVPACDLIIDAGANVGQFARAAVEVYPGCRVISFEPLPGVAAELRANLSSAPRWSCREIALGSVAGRANMHHHVYSPSSSLLRSSTEFSVQHSFEPDEQIVEVEVLPLDAALAGESLEGVCLLKLDLQGYEFEALKGASRTLTHFSHVLVEVSFVQVYEQEATFDQVHDALRAAGFTLVAPLDVLRGASKSVVQLDLLYSK